MSIDITQLENMVFSEKRQDFLKNLIVGTESYYYFHLMQALNTEGSEISYQTEALMKQYLDQNYTSSLSINIRLLLQKLEGAKDKEKRKEIIQKINDIIFNYRFDYQQPLQVSNSNLQTTTQKKYTEVFKGDTTLKTLISNTYSKKINDYSPTALLNITESQFQSLGKKERLKFFQKIGIYINACKFKKLVLETILQTEIDQLKILSYFLTSEDLMNLYQLNKKYVYDNLQAEILKKTFPDLSNYDSDDPNYPDKDKYFSEILKWFISVFGENDTVDILFIYQKVLYYAMKKQIYDFQSFQKYLTIKHRIKYVNIEQFKGQSMLKYEINPLGNDQLKKMEANYIKRYLEQHKNVKPFESIVQKDVLKKLEAKYNLYQGKAVEGISNILTSNKIDSISKKKKLKLDDRNKEYFNEVEEVYLDLVIKNIQSLQVRVFEINMFNYYKINQSDINQDIDLDGLVASEETSFAFNNPQFEIFIKRFKFESIQKKKNGVFVVDFIGNGIASRALIRKGTLIVKDKQTLAGHAFQILDEKLNVCIGKKTGIYLERKFYAADKSGEVVIPYGSKQITSKAILVHEDFSSLASLTIEKENYDLQCAFIYSTESMLMSHKAKVLIQPRLYLNNTSVPLNILTESKITVTSMNNMQVPQTTVINKLNLTHKEEVEIEFPIAQNFTDVTITFSTKIKTISSSSISKECSHKIRFSNSSTPHFCIQNLRLTQEGYEIELLGQNGEPKKNINLSIRLQQEYIFNQNQRITLTTNQQGIARLGELQNIKQVESQVQQKGEIFAGSQIWDISNYKQASYPSLIKILETQPLQLPIIDSQQMNYLLLQTLSAEQDQFILKDFTSKINLIPGYLAIRNLSAGFYTLYLIHQDIKVQIEVYKGKTWNNTNLIQTENSLIGQQKNEGILFIEKVEQKKIQQKCDGIEIEEQSQDLSMKVKVFSNNLSLLRVHILAFNYMQNNPNVQLNSLNKVRQVSEEEDLDINYENLRCIYASNKTLSDEVRYVLDRKQQTRYIGNYLEKPQILLKRTLVQETTEISNQSMEGSAFTSSTVSHKKSKCKKKKMMMSGGASHNLTPQNSDVECEVNKLKNYLLYPAVLFSNLKPNSDGEIEIPVFNTKFYSAIQIIATDLNANASYILPLPKNQIVKRNLTQQAPKESSQGFSTISRNMTTVLQEDQIQQSDFTSTQIQLIDSIPKLFSAFKDLVKLNPVYKNNEDKQDLNSWDFIVKWNSFSLEEKHKKYNKFASHELNIFIYFKDFSYFENFIKPFLQYKIEKTFIDFFLLNMKEEIEEYLSSDQLCSLNVLEQVLLIIYCKSQNKKEEGEIILLYLENQNKTKKKDTSYFKRLFDTVLFAKVEGEESTIPSIQQQIVQQAQYLQNQNANLNNNNILIQQPMLQQPLMLLQQGQHIPQMQQVLSNALPPQLNQMLNPRMMQQSLPNQQYCQLPTSALGYSLPPLNAKQQQLGQQFIQQLQQQQQQQQSPQQLLLLQQQPLSQQQQQPLSQQQQQLLPQQQQQQQQQQQSHFMNLANYSSLNNNLLYGQYNSIENLAMDYQDNIDKYKKLRDNYLAEFKNAEQPKEYCERNYFNVKSKILTIQVNDFWVDLARHILNQPNEKPFLSTNFIYCNQNFTEVLAVLSFIALPFDTPSHNYLPFEGKGLIIKTGSNCLVFTKEIKEGTAKLRDDILVYQKMFDPAERYIFSEENPNEKWEKKISEYVIDKRYGSSVIVTNCSSSSQEFQVLVSIPEGSIPVQSDDFSKTHNISLEPLQTKIIEAYFYFPQPGLFTINPANVAQNGVVQSVANKLSFDVKNERTITNLETLEEILLKGSQQDILNFVKTKNILNTNIFKFSEIYYLLKKKTFFKEFINILRERKIFDEITWSFSIYHGSCKVFKQLLNNQEIKQKFERLRIYYLKNSFINLNQLNLLEYYPLQHPRTHKLHKDKSNILNKQFREQYQKFLFYLIEKNERTVSDNLAIIYYFLLQERVEEAITIYQSIDLNKIKNANLCKLQYDYITCFLDFYTGYPNFRKAREICENYLDYPIISWRNLFYEVANKLAEYDNEDKYAQEFNESEMSIEYKDIQVNKKKMKEQLKEELSQQIQLQLEQQQIVITCLNTQTLLIKYYLIDLEILFSRNPFISSKKCDFDFVKPNYEQEMNVDLSKGLQKVIVDIPERFLKSNVYIQVSATDVQENITYFSNSIQVEILQDLGQIKVTDKENNPLSKVYVKCFAQDQSNKNSFHKDGYTDIVGKFDYASKASTQISKISEFALFIMSDELGSTIKMAKPPKGIGQIVDEVKLSGLNWTNRAQSRNLKQKTDYVQQMMENMKFANQFNQS